MKRYFVPVLLILLACSGSPTTPGLDVPTATLKKSAPCDAEVLGAGEIVGGDATHETVIFATTPCATDVRVKVWFVYPNDARSKPVASVDAPEVDGPFGANHQFTFHWKVPKEAATFQDPWFPKFYVEVRSEGKLIGSFNVWDS